MKSGPLHRAGHAALQVPIRRHGHAFPSFKSVDMAAAEIVRRQARAYDKDVLRHALTMAMLLDKLPSATIQIRSSLLVMDSEQWHR